MNTINETSLVSASFIIIAVILVTIVIGTIVGNFFVILAILIDKNLQTTANQLVLSLAVADLMVACLVMPLGAYNDIYQGWYLSKEVCEFWTSADVLCCTASILNLLAIALDRYWAVTNVDYIYRRTRQRVNIMILCAWTVGAIVSLAPIFGWKDPDFASRVLEEHKCMVSQDVGYQVFATISTFYAPLVLLLGLYWRIFKVARKRIRRKPGRQAILPTSAVSVTRLHYQQPQITINHPQVSVDADSPPLPPPPTSPIILEHSNNINNNSTNDSSSDYQNENQSDSIYAHRKQINVQNNNIKSNSINNNNSERTYKNNNINTIEDPTNTATINFKRPQVAQSSACCASQLNIDPNETTQRVVHDECATLSHLGSTHTQDQGTRNNDSDNVSTSDRRWEKGGHSNQDKVNSKGCKCKQRHQRQRPHHQHSGLIGGSAMDKSSTERANSSVATTVRQDGGACLPSNNGDKIAGEASASDTRSQSYAKVGEKEEGDRGLTGVGVAVSDNSKSMLFIEFKQQKNRDQQGGGLGRPPVKTSQRFSHESLDEFNEHEKDYVVERSSGSGNFGVTFPSNIGNIQRGEERQNFPHRLLKCTSGRSALINCSVKDSTDKVRPSNEGEDKKEWYRKEQEYKHFVDRQKRMVDNKNNELPPKTLPSSKRTMVSSCKSPLVVVGWVGAGKENRKLVDSMEASASRIVPRSELESGSEQTTTTNGRLTANFSGSNDERVDSSIVPANNNSQMLSLSAVDRSGGGCEKKKKKKKNDDNKKLQAAGSTTGSDILHPEQFLSACSTLTQERKKFRWMMMIERREREKEKGLNYDDGFPKDEVENSNPSCTQLSVSDAKSGGEGAGSRQLESRTVLETKKHTSLAVRESNMMTSSRQPTDERDQGGHDGDVKDEEDDDDEEGNGREDVDCCCCLCDTCAQVSAGGEDSFDENCTRAQCSVCGGIENDSKQIDDSVMTAKIRPEMSNPQVMMTLSPVSLASGDVFDTQTCDYQGLNLSSSQENQGSAKFGHSKKTLECQQHNINTHDKVCLRELSQKLHQSTNIEPRGRRTNKNTEKIAKKREGEKPPAEVAKTAAFYNEIEKAQINHCRQRQPPVLVQGGAAKKSAPSSEEEGRGGDVGLLEAERRALLAPSKKKDKSKDKEQKQAEQRQLMSGAFNIESGTVSSAKMTAGYGNENFHTVQLASGVWKDRSITKVVAEVTKKEEEEKSSKTRTDTNERIGKRLALAGEALKGKHLSGRASSSPTFTKTATHQGRPREEWNLKESQGSTNMPTTKHLGSYRHGSGNVCKCSSKSKSNSSVSCASSGGLSSSTLTSQEECSNSSIMMSSEYLIESLDLDQRRRCNRESVSRIDESSSSNNIDTESSTSSHSRISNSVNDEFCDASSTVAPATTADLLNETKLEQYEDDDLSLSASFPPPIESVLRKERLLSEHESSGHYQHHHHHHHHEQKPCLSSNLSKDGGSKKGGSKKGPQVQVAPIHEHTSHDTPSPINGTKLKEKEENNQEVLETLDTRNHLIKGEKAGGGALQLGFKQRANPREVISTSYYDKMITFDVERNTTTTLNHNNKLQQQGPNKTKKVCLNTTTNEIHKKPTSYLPVRLNSSFEDKKQLQPPTQLKRTTLDLRRKLRVVGQLVSFVQTSRNFNSSSFSSGPTTSQSGSNDENNNNHQEHDPPSHGLVNCSILNVNRAKVAPRPSLVQQEGQQRLNIFTVEKGVTSGKNGPVFEEEEGRTGKPLKHFSSIEEQEKNSSCSDEEQENHVVSQEKKQFHHKYENEQQALELDKSQSFELEQQQRQQTMLNRNSPLAVQHQNRRRTEAMDIRRERKAAKTLAIITGVFVCCWLPFFLNAIIMPICGPACTPNDIILSILLWLGYVNSLLNPIIYTIFSPDFRRAFRRLLCWPVLVRFASTFHKSPSTHDAAMMIA